MDKITVNGALTLPQSKTFCEGVVIAGQGSVNGHALQTGNCFFVAANEPPLSFSGSLIQNSSRNQRVHCNLHPNLSAEFGNYYF